jgi:hypothetical protein
MKPYFSLFIVPALVLGGCKQEPPPDKPSRTLPRTDFSPEEFGIGRKHTKSAACNLEIDELLEQLRRCYAARPTAECDVMQRDSSDRIARLKNTSRCSH